MQNPPEIRRRLHLAAAAAVAGDVAGLYAAEEWLLGVTARELVRIDGIARRRGPALTLGASGQWSRAVMAQPSPAPVALASMHPDGRVRERAVDRLVTATGMIAERALAVRVSDHVRVIREKAARAVLDRTTLEAAASIMPVLEVLKERVRPGPVPGLYLQRIVERHGEAQVWASLRASSDRRLRRSAYRHSIDTDLLGVDQAVADLPRERDQVVRSILAHLIADEAPAAVLVEVLLGARSAESRALGLVRLDAGQIEPATLKRLLVDTSVLVRLWARQRWAEQGRDAHAAYGAIAHGDGPPRVRARAYTGLLEVGDTVERAEALRLLQSGESALVRVGLTVLADRAEPADAAELFGVMRAGTAKEARLAAAGLVRIRRAWTVEELRRFKEATDAELRRRGWWLRRGLGGWERTIADLEVLRDPDPELAHLGRGVLAPQYAAPTDAQRERLRDLIPGARLSRDRVGDLAVAAGLRELLTQHVDRP